MKFKTFFSVVLILSVFTILFSSNKYPEDLKDLWKQVDKYLIKDQPTQANKVLDKILSIATEKHLDDDIIKVFIKKGKVFSAISWKISGYDKLQTTRNFLYKQYNYQHSDIVKMYLHYSLLNLYITALNQYNPDIWNISEKNTKLMFWGTKQYLDSIQYHLEYLYKNFDKIEKIPVYKYSFIKKKDTTFYPYMSDIFIKSITTEINKLLSSKYLDNFDFELLQNDTILSQYKNFNKLTSTNNIKNKYPITSLLIKLWQKEEYFAKQSQNINSFAQAEYDRIYTFYNLYLGISNTDSLLETTYNKDIKEFANKPASILFAYALAEHYIEQNPKKALDICKKFLNKYPDYPYSKNLKNIELQILSKNLSLTTEDNILPNTHSILTADFKNISEFALNIYRITLKDYISNHYLLSELAKGKKVYKTKKYKLPIYSDYQSHTVALDFPMLNAGFYLVEAIGKGLNKNYFMINVSNLGYVIYNLTNNNAALKIHKLSNGNIVKKVKVTFTKNRGIKKTEKITNGIIKYNPDNFYRWVIISANGDTAAYNNPYFYMPQTYNNKKIKQYIYTDRKTYRPGETVYCKVIMVRDNYATKKRNILKNKKIELQFKDKNNEVLYTKSLTTGEDGSVFTSFVIPNDIPIGDAYISASGVGAYKTISLNIEPYKLPKVFFDFDLAKKDYSLGDTVSIKGKITSYSGMPVNGTQVIWNVKYSNQSNIVKSSWRPWSLPKFFLTRGNLTIKDTGNFSFGFPTNIKINSDNITLYVNVKIILPSGETYEKNKQIKLSKSPYKIYTNIPNIILATQDSSISFNLKAYQQNNISAPLSITLYKVNEPSTPTITNISADTTTIMEKEWKKNFYYTSCPNNKEKTKKILVKTIYNGKLYLPNNLTQGYYKIQANTEYHNKKITSNFYFHYLNPSSKTATTSLPLYIIPLKKPQALKGSEKIKLLVGSGLKNSIVSVLIFDGCKLLNSFQLKLKVAQNTITINIPDTIENKIKVFAYTFSHGYYMSDNIIFEKYIPTVKLNIKQISHHTLPNKKESITLQFTDNKNKPVSGWIFATQYDKSIEKFGKNNWELPQPYFYTLAKLKHNSHSAGYTYLSQSTSYPHIFMPETDKLPTIVNNTSYRYLSLERGAKAVSPAASKGVRHIGEKPLENNMDISEEDKDTQKEANTKKQYERTNFNPTAFFYPSLHTNKNGIVTITYTVPDALTTWKFMAMGYNSQWQADTSIAETISNKPLMITSDLPRFLREGDNMEFPITFSNLTKSKQSATYNVSFANANTDSIIMQKHGTVTLKAKQSTTVYIAVKVPDNTNLLTYQSRLSGNEYSDAEKKFVPVLSNKTFITQTLPFYINKKGTKNLIFKEFEQYRKSSTIQNYAYTIEVTSNPLWFAVQAIPSLQYSNFDITSNIYSSLFASITGTYIINSYPAIKNVFEKWKHLKSKNTFLSNLEKNKDLKSFILRNTPWLTEAKDETEQKRRLSILFDINSLSAQRSVLISKLINRQTNNGAWKWHYLSKQGDLYTTMQIVKGFGELQYTIDYKVPYKLSKSINKALAYIDNEIKKQFENIKRHDENYKKHKYISHTTINYLYIRALWQHNNPDNKYNEAIEYFTQQAKTYWNTFDIYDKALIGEIFILTNTNNKIANDIIASIKDYAIHDEEKGIYWKTNNNFHFYSQGILTHTEIMKLFTDAKVNKDYLDKMKIWLLKHKQTNRWKSDLETEEAIILLLADKNKFDLNDNSLITVKVGSFDVTNYAKQHNIVEPGTGYFKVTLTSQNIKKDFAHIYIHKPNDKNIAWGAIYWQYFENMDKIKKSTNNKIAISRKIYKVVSQNGKTKYIPIEKTSLKKGDKIKIRLIITADRNYEYIAVRDYRPSSFEPINTKAQYGYSGNAYYFSSVSDEKNDFFLRYLPQGTTYLEYEAYVHYNGEFSGGYSLVQSLYAPEFTSNTQGIRIKINKQ